MSASRTVFKRIESLTPEQLKGLVEAGQTQRMWPKRYPRMGLHGMDRPSVYETCSLFKIPFNEARVIKSFIPPKFGDESVVRYFLNFPAKEGFLDGQSCWIGVPRPMDIVAWSLTDDNQIRVSTPLDDDIPLKDKLRPGNIVIADGVTQIVQRSGSVTLANSKITAVQTPPKTHTFNKGEGFLMSLNHYHEILKRDDAHQWFCLGIMTEVD